MKSIGRIILVCGLLLAQTSFAQRFERLLNLDVWRLGEVVLTDGQVVPGEINHNYILHVIQVRNGEKTQTFPQQQIASFKFFKTEELREANYIPLDLGVAEGIFEVIGENDELAFLAFNTVGEQLVTTPMYGPNAFGPTNTYVSTIDRKAEQYYLVTKQGEIQFLGEILISRNNKRGMSSDIRAKKVAALLAEHEPSVVSFIQDAQLKLRRREDLVRAMRWVVNKGSE